MEPARAEQHHRAQPSLRGLHDLGGRACLASGRGGVFAEYRRNGRIFPFQRYKRKPHRKKNTPKPLVWQDHWRFNASRRYRARTSDGQGVDRSARPRLRPGVRPYRSAGLSISPKASWRLDTHHPDLEQAMSTLLSSSGISEEDGLRRLPPIRHARTGAVPVRPRKAQHGRGRTSISDGVYVAS
jgi:hypothetical protein